MTSRQARSIALQACQIDIADQMFRLRAMTDRSRGHRVDPGSGGVTMDQHPADTCRLVRVGMSPTRAKLAHRFVDQSQQAAHRDGRGSPGANREIRFAQVSPGVMPTRYAAGTLQLNETGFVDVPPASLPTHPRSGHQFPTGPSGRETSVPGFVHRAR